LEIRMLSGGLVELEGPRWTEWIAVEVSDRGNEALPELLFGGDTDVAQDGAGQLGEEAFDEVEPGAVLGSEGELKSAGGLLGEPSSGLSGDMGGVIVEDQMDRRVGRVGRVDELEELDELPATVAILHQGVNLAGQQVNTGQQADRAVALVFMIARQRRMHAGLRRQIRCRRCNRLDARLLVVADDRHRITRLLA